MFDGLAEHEGRQTVADCNLFFLYKIAYFVYCFFLIYLY